MYDEFIQKLTQNSNINFSGGGTLRLQDNTTVQNANASSRAINVSNGTTLNVDGARFIDNTGGAIGVNTGTLKFDSGTSTFTNNSITATGNNFVVGGAIYLTSANVANGALYSPFTGNHVSAVGNYAAGGAIFSNNSSELTIASDMKNNYASTTSENNKALGGAIYSNSPIKILADANKPTVEITGNYTDNNGVKEYNAIFIDTTNGSNGALTINTATGGNTVTINDIIDGGSVDSTKNVVSYIDSKYTTNITGAGTVNINNIIFI